MMGLGAAKIFSLGIAIPWADRIATRYVMRNVMFGNTRGRFEPESDDLWGIHFATVFLLLPTLGLSRFWYAVALQRYQYRNFRIGAMRLNSHVTGGALFWLVLGNLLIVALTLGLGKPFAIQREMRFLATHISLSGGLSAMTDEIRQSGEELSTSGEGLEEFLGDSGLV